MTLIAPGKEAPAGWPCAVAGAWLCAVAMLCSSAIGQTAPPAASPAGLSELGQVENALKATPADAALRFKRAVLLADAGRNAEALVLLRQLSEQYPDLVEPLNNQAVLLAQSGDLDAARQALEQALRLDPRHGLVRLNLGEIYLLMAQRTWEGVPVAARETAQIRRLDLLKSLLASPR